MYCHSLCVESLGSWDFFFPNRNPLACFLQYVACISFLMRLLAFYLRECRMMWMTSFPAEAPQNALKPLCFKGQKPCQFMAAHQIPGVQISFSNRRLVRCEEKKLYRSNMWQRRECTFIFLFPRFFSIYFVFSWLAPYWTCARKSKELRMKIGEAESYNDVFDWKVS